MIIDNTVSVLEERMGQFKQLDEAVKRKRTAKLRKEWVKDRGNFVFHSGILWKHAEQSCEEALEAYQERRKRVEEMSEKFLSRFKVIYNDLCLARTMKNKMNERLDRRLRFFKKDNQTA